MKITLAFEEDDGSSWLVSSYDESTFDAHNGVPDFHTEQLAKCSGRVRECEITIPDRFVDGLFETPELPVTDWQPKEAS